MVQKRWVCVGRDDELASLARTVDPRQRPHGALVSGEPGVGKTRMLEESVEMARALGRPATTVRARRGTSAVPGGAFLDALPTAPPSGDPMTLVWWLRNTLVHSGERPLLIVDDAHFADEVSLAVVSHLLETEAASVILAARTTETWPDDLVSFGTTPGIARIVLAPLSPADTAALTAKIAGTAVPAENGAEVFRLTVGLPLAVRELVRASEEVGNPVWSPTGWRWEADLADDPGVADVVRSRLATATERLRGLMRVLVACGGSAPEQTCIALTSTAAVEEALRREIVTTDGDWLTWSHALIGEVVTAGEPLAGIAEVRLAARAHLLDAAKPDDRRVLLLGELDRAESEPEPSVQLMAANAALALGRMDRVAVHAEAALTRDPGSSEALGLLAVARAGEGRPEDARLIERAVTEAPDADTRLLVATRVLRRMIDLGGDVQAIAEELREVADRLSDSILRHRVEHLRLVHLAAADPAGFVPATMAFLDDPSVPVGERAGAEGFLAMRLAASGGLEGALDHADRATTAWRDSLDAHDAVGGWYAGALARLFSGRGREAVEFVQRGSDLILPHTSGPREWLIIRSLRFMMHPSVGHVGSELPSLVPIADEVGSVLYGYFIRLLAAWELALQADPAADLLYGEAVDAPDRLRQGPMWIEAIVQVALRAARGDRDGAATMALELADRAGDAPPRRAWLLHDAARHGRPAAVVEELERLATPGDNPFFTLLARSARAIDGKDGDACAACASAFAAAGFGLFAAEHGAMAAEAFRRDQRSPDAARATARALAHRTELGGPTTPLLHDLESHPLTPRQREICRLAATGLANGEIARLLGISRRTVENQLHRSYGLLGVGREELRTIAL